jgi:hypothetical protein
VVTVWPMRKEKRDDVDLSVANQDQSCVIDIVIWIGESKHIGQTTCWSLERCATL